MAKKNKDTAPAEEIPEVKEKKPRAKRTPKVEEPQLDLSALESPPPPSLQQEYEGALRHLQHIEAHGFRATKQIQGLEVELAEVNRQVIQLSEWLAKAEGELGLPVQRRYSSHP